jgi:predicted membrane protein DUF2231
VLTRINGLPAHVLLVHAVVVLVPLAALMVVLAAVWPAFRRRAGVAVPVMALVALVCIPLTTSAGEWLAQRVPSTPLLRKHTELGDTLLPWMVGVFAVAVATWAITWWLDRSARKEGAGEPSGRWRLVRIVVAVLALAVATGAVVQTYRIGDSGAHAAWSNRAQ